MHLYMIKNAEQTWTATHDMLLPLLSEERQKKVLRYRFDSDKILSLYAGVLTRLALMRELSCSNDQLAFTQTDRKKPRLLPAPTHPYPVDFSFSHTRQAVLLGVTKKGQIGVDIEQIQSAPFRIMPSVFHPAEITYVEQAPDTKKNHHFYEIWTRKEAYAKCLGTGLSKELTSINTLASPIKEALYSWTMENYMCSVCVKK